MAGREVISMIRVILDLFQADGVVIGLYGSREEAEAGVRRHRADWALCTGQEPPSEACYALDEV
jgi:hypothetical protein